MGNYSIREGGEANFWDLLDLKGHWVAQIQFNGELTDEKQLALATKMAEGAVPAPVQPAPSEEEVDPPDALLRDVIDYAEAGKVPEPWMVRGLISLRAQLAEWNRIKALFREEARYRKDARNPYGSHGHQISGIWDWDSDNGPLAGHECAACAAARAALDGKEKA